MECTDKQEDSSAFAIKVIGVGNCGINAIESLIRKDLNGVGRIVADTDSQSLDRSLAGCKIQLGIQLAGGLGTKRNPQIGCQAAMENLEEIKAALGKAGVVVVVAGMGGGTGTGAAPVIAQAAREMGAITVGVVTMPFTFEGSRSRDNADAGVNALRGHVDSLIIIPNESLLALASKEGICVKSFSEILGKAWEVLYIMGKNIVDLIAERDITNLDCDKVKAALVGSVDADDVAGYMPDELKTAKLCLAAVRKYGMALQHVPEELKTPEISLAAVQHYDDAFQYVPESLITPEFCLAAVQLNGWSLQRVPNDLMTSELCLAALQQNGRALKYVPKNLMTTELCLAAVQRDGLAFTNVPNDLMTAELCLAAVQQYGCALRSVPNDLMTSELCLAAIQKNGYALRYVPKDLRTVELCRVAVKDNGWALQYVPNDLLTAELCLAAVQQKGEALEYVPKDLRTAELCLVAVQQQGSALKHVPGRLKTTELCRIAGQNGAMRQQGQEEPLSC